MIRLTMLFGAILRSKSHTVHPKHVVTIDTRIIRSPSKLRWWPTKSVATTPSATRFSVPSHSAACGFVFTSRCPTPEAREERRKRVNSWTSSTIFSQCDLHARPSSIFVLFWTASS
ncbi:hypothetical protein PPTG_23235 [Phytophthora nicotianae INRA-310]|uniref:Uncharacterized protein n=2 Tax=Phytophthora nicotianae TaxID=4792 RepID=W2Q2R4_PHYN3|nr:hypothetical protein PPTG_23235 [Phytophthora nicotianae INRA-310]ETI43600.1 hypothetical protein F443_11492 [Phytophthora nicotianae P1569]ETN07171.1 hypothetical protein PPTG_23235 [Phytophthora nicotianae INRA-310]